MDEDMKEAEIVIAQRLASGESERIRKRALNYLREHIKQQSAKNAFTSDSLARLCKGLHYALWMQDKMLLQEELADNICDLFNLFQDDEKMLEFVEAMVFSLSKEWPGIDRWRMDKFLMLLRRIVRTLFGRLAKSDWAPDLTTQYLNFFSGTFISLNARVSESLKYHCASFWLDELDNAVGDRGLNKEQCLHFIRPYIRLIQQNISKTFFGTICTDIFDTILHDCSEQQANSKRRKLEEEFVQDEKDDESIDEAGKGVEEEEEHSTQAGLEFDYAKIAEEMFEAGKQSGLQAKRRKRIYGLCKKFESAAKGKDPLPHPLEDLPRKKRRNRKRKSTK